MKVKVIRDQLNNELEQLFETAYLKEGVEYEAYEDEWKDGGAIIVLIWFPDGTGDEITLYKGEYEVVDHES